MSLREGVAAITVIALCAFGISTAIGAKRPVFPGVFAATATGKKEVSTTTGKKNAGDQGARAGFTAVIDGGQLCWAIVAKNVDGTLSGAHIHKGAANVNGPVVVPLDPPTSGDPGTSSACQEITAALAAAITKNPAKHYFNLHSTPSFPGGAVRGQLSWKTK